MKTLYGIIIPLSILIYFSDRINSDIALILVLPVLLVSLLMLKSLNSSSTNRALNNITYTVIKHHFPTESENVVKAFLSSDKYKWLAKNNNNVKTINDQIETLIISNYKSFKKSFYN